MNGNVQCWATGRFEKAADKQKNPRLDRWVEVTPQTLSRQREGGRERVTEGDTPFEFVRAVVVLDSK